MTALSADDHAALNLLAGGLLFRTNDRRFYQRRNAPSVTAYRVDRLAESGLVNIFEFNADGRLVTAARLTKDGRQARAQGTDK